MNVAALIELGVDLHLEGERLVVKGRIDDATVEAIRRHRETLVAELRGNTCSRCFDWWRIDAEAGDCLKHHFKTLPADDCGAWRPWQGHALREINS